jgi:hypothetical protein
MEEQEHLFRFASWRIHESLVKKPLPIDKFWQIGKPKPMVKKEFPMEWWETTKAKHARIDEKLKQAK